MIHFLMLYVGAYDWPVSLSCNTKNVQKIKNNRD